MEYTVLEDHSGTPEDTANYIFFFQAIHNTCDKLGQAKGRYFPLMAALPCGPGYTGWTQFDELWFARGLECTLRDQCSHVWSWVEGLIEAVVRT